MPDQVAPAHIAINAHLLSLSDSYRGAGIHRYIYALLEYLPRVSRPFRGSHRFTAYLGDPRAGHRAWPGLDVRLSPFSTVSPAVRVFWEQLFLPARLLSDGIDLVHGPAYALPLLGPARSVVTVHDLSFFMYPQTFNRPNRLYLQLMTRLSVQRADAVIAVSQHTRQDVIRLLNAPVDRVHTVPNGIDPEFHPLPEDKKQDFREQRQLPERFILCISTIEPRKNLTTLIRAYATLNGVECSLIIGGGRGWRYESVFALVEELRLKDRVLFPGFIPHAELPYWYNLADIFVFPSIYEGFGLPPLEAMACGTPVIVSNTSSLPEVVGSAGQLVDPTDVNALADAMRHVLADGALATSMAEQGLSQAERFSWRATAERTMAVYDAVLEPNTTSPEPIEGVERSR